MGKRLLGTQMYQGFHLEEIQIDPEADQEGSIHVSWKISRIEGGPSPYQHDYGYATSLEQAKQKIDDILKS